MASITVLSVLSLQIELFQSIMLSTVKHFGYNEFSPILYLSQCYRSKQYDTSCESVQTPRCFHKNELIGNRRRLLANDKDHKTWAMTWEYPCRTTLSTVPKSKHREILLKTT